MNESRSHNDINVVGYFGRVEVVDKLCNAFLGAVALPVAADEELAVSSHTGDLASAVAASA